MVLHSQVLWWENDAKIKKWLLNNDPPEGTTRKTWANDKTYCVTVTSFVKTSEKSKVVHLWGVWLAQ